MADWDVVSKIPITAPPVAAGADPWAVKTTQPASVLRGVADKIGGIVSRAPQTGALEMLGSMATGVLSQIPAGLAGAGAGVSNLVADAVGAKEPFEPAADVVENVRNKLTYQPQSESGRAAQQTLGSAVNAVTQDPTVQSVGNAVGQVVDNTGFGNEIRSFAPAAAEAALNVVPLAKGLGAAARAGEVAANAAETAAKNAPAWQKAGFRTAEDHPIARDVAGASGKDALVLHNQKIGNTVVGADAGVPHGTDLSYEALETAQQAPNAVYNRVAKALGDNGALSPGARAQVEAAGARANRITKGSPDAVSKVGALKDELLNAKDLSGDRIVNELRGLRQEGYTNLASEDVSNQQLGHAQLDMARGLETHIAESLPKNADVSLDQFQKARTALAKNHAVKSALRGSDVDLQALARAQRADPELLTDGLKAAADFANEHPTVSGLASKVYSPPGYVQDVMGVPGTHKLENFLSPSFWTGLGGGKAAARRVLTGSTDKAVEGARKAFPAGLGDELAPIPVRGPEPPPGMTAETPPMVGPRAAPQGDIPLADLLAHGVEQPPATGFSLGDMVAPKKGGIPFSRNTEYMAGDLELAPETPRGAMPGQNRDLGSVMSQGVPEGIMQRSTPAHEPDLFDLISGNRGEGFTTMPSVPAPAGKRFTGVLYRGAKEGTDVDKLNEAGGRFLTPNVVAEEGGTAAADYGPNQKAYKISSRNMLDVGDPGKTASALNLPKSANMIDIAKAAVKAGYDLVRVKVGKGYEYIHFPDGAPAGG